MHDASFRISTILSVSFRARTVLLGRRSSLGPRWVICGSPIFGRHLVRRRIPSHLFARLDGVWNTRHHGTKANWSLFNQKTRHTDFIFISPVRTVTPRYRPLSISSSHVTQTAAGRPRASTQHTPWKTLCNSCFEIAQ